MRICVAPSQDTFGRYGESVLPVHNNKCHLLTQSSSVFEYITFVSNVLIAASQSNFRRQVHCFGLHEIRSRDEPRIIERQIPARPRQRLHNSIHHVMKVHRIMKLSWTHIRFWLVDDLIHACSSQLRELWTSTERLCGNLKTPATLLHANHANDANWDGRSCKKSRDYCQSVPPRYKAMSTTHHKICFIVIILNFQFKFDVILISNYIHLISSHSFQQGATSCPRMFKVLFPAGIETFEFKGGWKTHQSGVQGGALIFFLESWTT